MGGGEDEDEERGDEDVCVRRVVACSVPLSGGEDDELLEDLRNLFE